MSVPTLLSQKVIFPLLACAAAACGGGGATPSDGGGGGGADVAPPTWSPPMGMCDVQTVTMPIAGANHLGECAPLPAAPSPRTSGDHYGSWPMFRVYDKPVPWGFLLHGLEHGAVVIVHNCPGGCAADIDAAKQMVAAATPKPACVPPRPPIIMTPDPTLEAGYTFAAAAWGKGLRAKCFDAAAFTQFVQANVNKGPELFPNDCGAVDKEAMGWCP